MALATTLFDYNLPAAAIAQTPADRRDASRLLVVHRATKMIEHRHFWELPEVLKEAGITKAEFFRNNAKVIKARMFLNRASGGEVELLLLRPGTDHRKYWTLTRPLKKLKIGEMVYGGKEEVARLLERSETGEALWEFTNDPLAWAEKLGKLPLPPYIAREKADARDVADVIRYQTVYAAPPVAAAAPTAGLHWTSELIAKMEAEGNKFHDLTLHVGLDTFRPVSTETIEEHKIHTETYEVPIATAEALKAKSFKIAVGTTSLRTIEDFVRRGNLEAGVPHAASIFVYPPQKIISADGLITNFHLPKSTLMCLVAAFLTPGSMDGITWLKEIYAEALKEGYRFYSYGDAMVVL